MDAYIQRFRLWWQQREPRERWMLGVMVTAVAAFVLWYGAVAPLRKASDAAQARYDRATLALLQAELQLAQLRALDQRPQAAADTAALKQAVLEAAGKAGLAVSREREHGADGFGIEADAASPAQLFGWLDALRLRHGLAPATLSVARSEGQLRVQAGFEPAQ